MLIIHTISLFQTHAANALYLHRNTIQKAADVFSGELIFANTASTAFRFSFLLYLYTIKPLKTIFLMK